MYSVPLRRPFLSLLLSCTAAIAVCAPARAIPDAATPTLVGGSVGAELVVSGPGVSGGNLAYYVYGSAGIARSFSARAELLAGGGRKSMTVVSAEFSALPTPVVTVNFEPGVTWAGGSAGPSLGLRGTGSLPVIKLGVTGYGRVHLINSRVTTEFGLGLDYPVAPHLRASLSAIQFNGGFEPNGLLILLGIKAKLG
ncbi:MAG: hypothetical protein LC772_08435, partial [Chloroflexi bacterium]|nr:hypothetical protein [Chloroflexota bacterium]